MIDAVKTGDAGWVRELLQANPALVNARSSTGESAILLATYYGRTEIAGLLLAADPTLSLFEAVAVGQANVVAEGLEAQPDLVNAYSHDGFTPLALASFFGHDQIVALLLARGAEVNAVSQNAMRVMPLHSAVAGQHLRVARALLAHGAEVNAAQAGDFTPLHGAAQNGQLEMVALLLSYGATVNPHSAGEQTPLALALEGGHEQVANLLRQRGAV
jgi:ankyrin repeat protein